MELMLSLYIEGYYRKQITSNFITGKTEVKAKIILLHTYLSLCSCRNTQ